VTGSYQIECNAVSGYIALLITGIVTLIIWGLAIPIFLSLVIWKNTKAQTNYTEYK
jgi:type IV secretory pathway VirB6-like protein